jgi:hypothetical protein
MLATGAVLHRPRDRKTSDSSAFIRKQSQFSV